VVGEVTQREVGLTPTARGVLLGTIVAVTALLHASWDAGAGGPIRRSIGLRVVDATTYASIGVVRALFRVAAREFVFVTMVIGTSTFVGDRLPAPGPRQAWFVAGWLAACRVVPLAAAWYLPRGRGAHDLIARTIVIQAGPTTMPPIVEPVLLARRPALVRS